MADEFNQRACLLESHVVLLLSSLSTPVLHYFKGLASARPTESFYRLLFHLNSSILWSECMLWANLGKFLHSSTLCQLAIFLTKLTSLLSKFVSSSVSTLYWWQQLWRRCPLLWTDYETRCFESWYHIISHCAPAWVLVGFPGSSSCKESACQCRRHRRPGGFILCQKDTLEEQMQPTPVLLPGESHGQRSLVGYSPWGSQRIGHDWSDLITPPHAWVLEMIS